MVKTENTTKAAPLAAYILLDRSGSMSGRRWEEAIGAINTYVQTLRKSKVPAKVTVAAFDSSYTSLSATALNTNLWPTRRGCTSMSFDILRDKQHISKFKAIAIDEMSPRGGTPLYDATARILNMADANNAEKTVVVIMTDGAENESVDYTLNAIRDRIATCQHRGWEVIMLGAEFNAEAVAQSYGLSATKAYNSDAGNMRNAMASYATASANYTMCGAAIDTTSLKI